MLPPKLKLILALWILTICGACFSAEAVKLPAQRVVISCLHCESSDDCEDARRLECPEGTDASLNEQCFMLFEPGVNNLIGMGCATEYPSEAEVTALVKQKALLLCEGNMCNDYNNWPRANDCAACNSPTDVNCASNPSQVNGAKRCAIFPYTECVELVTSKTGGNTVRGCLNDLETDLFYNCLTGADSSCRVCTGKDCNKQVVPPNRLQCHHCSSANNAHCVSSPNAVSICPLYDENDACVTRSESSGDIVRGCRSQLSCVGYSNNNCKECQGNGCNTVVLEPDDDVPTSEIGDPGMFQDLPLNCYHCDNAAECAASLGKVNMCYDNKNQVCTTAFDANNGSVIRRGCSDSLSSVCAGSGANCHQCKSNGCNTVLREADLIECLFCDGQSTHDCALQPTTVEGKRQCHKSCLTILYVRNETEVASVYETLRSCWDDLDLDDREDCAAGADAVNCKACSTPNCNTDVLRAERRSCYHCSEADGNCASPTAQKCNAWTANEQCFVEYDESGNLVEMGCGTKYEANELQLRVTAQRVWLCDGDNCNTRENVPKQQSCIICSSRTDPACAISPATVLTGTTCIQQPYTQCYTRILGDGHTERGCLNSLQEAEFYNCLTSANGTLCTFCEGADCNKQVYPAERQSCQVCSSDKDSACATSQPASAQLCLLSSPGDSCVTHIDGNGITQRNCASSLACNANDASKCDVCTAANCNTVNLQRKMDGKPGQWQPLPLTCLSCTSESDCSGTTSNAVTCSDTEWCMTVFAANGNVMRRGCSAAVETAHATYCDQNMASCHNCNSNRCNSATSQNAYVSCLYCDSQENIECITDPAAVKGRRMCNGRCMSTLYPRGHIANSTVYDLERGCVDDKEVADQLACSGAQCNACSTADCNTAIIPATRRSCYRCEGDSCEDPITSQCPGWQENDECFILFNRRNSVERMGCTSDLSESDAQVNAALLLTCAEDNCNSFSAIPTPKTCASCSSTSDERCATRPSAVPTVVQCNSLPHVECMTRVLSDGSTQRGCAGDLNIVAMNSCLSGNATDCTTCIGDRCNIDIFPANRLSCHRCNSLEDETCASSPESAEICPWYRADQQCSAKIVYGDTYRGCGFDFTCDDSNKQYCRMCDGPNCNVVDLEALAIGYPGRWQDAPINCYTCLNGECAGNALGLARKCEDNNNQNCGTVFATNGTVVQRGCTDLIYTKEYSQHCDDHPDLCKFCKSNGCNTATNTNAYIDCIYCDGADGRDCIFEPTKITRRRSCRDRCMSAAYARSDDASVLVQERTCWDDMDLDDREACASGNHANCAACTGAACNVALVPAATRLKCNHCDNKAECSAIATVWSGECANYKEHDECYTLFNLENSVERQGCLSDLPTTFVAESKRQLLLCNGDNCNNDDNLPTPHACIICDSRTRPECATQPTGPLDAAVCEDLPYTQCYMHLDEFGHTRRGCLADVDDALFVDCMSGNSTDCLVCTGNGCNNIMYPEDRRTCLRCDSESNAACENGAAASEICPVYKEEDGCVTTLAGEKTIRGCASDFTCDPNRRETCRVCEGDNCNTVNLLAANIGNPGRWQDLPLNCYHCNTTAECADGGGLIKMCETTNLQTCMTVFNAQGAVEKRGCSAGVIESHADYCDAATDNCIGCKSNGCNNGVNKAAYGDCYFCDSAQTGVACSVNLATGTARTRKCLGQCMVALYERNTAANTPYETTRSCLDDMDMDDRAACIAGTLENCQACSGARCNTQVLPAERHECYHCVGENCENPVVQSCSAYRANETCFTAFDVESTVIGMGCGSDYDDAVLLALVRQKQLLQCEGKNCNSPAKIPTPKMCSVCDSAKDARCATNPNLIGNYERCPQLPYTDCFTRINTAGHTHRGCMSALPADDFYGCLTGTDGLCETCTGDNCNEIDVYPSNRLRCHHCNSALDPFCVTAPDNSVVCPIYSRNDACVSNLHNGVTTRGCASNMKCDDPDDRRTCRTCTSNACNTVNLELVTDTSSPGLWQDVPINCYTCSNETDCAGPPRLWVCENDPYQSCMTVFSTTGAVVQRGCSNSLTSANSAHCNSNPDRCMSCNSNGCNTPSSLTDYIECWACDSHSTGDCTSNLAAVTSTRQCNKQCMTALYPRFAEDNPSYGLVRSCLDDKDLDDRDVCAAGGDANCQACSTGKCNTAIVPANRLSCYICTDDECQAPKAQQCPYHRDGDRCYIRFDEQRSIVALGCGSEFSNAEGGYLLSQKRLFYCDGADCNTLDALPASQSCTLCNSRTDTSCATSPGSVLTTTTCSTPGYPNCYQRVLTDGATERGCLASLYDDEFVGCLNGTSATCQSCMGTKCNNEKYPSGRTSCHICDSSSDPTCETNPNHLSVCPWYAEGDTCVTAFANDETRRGCSSTLSCDVTNSRTCVQCEGDGCNTVNLAKKQDSNFGRWQDLPLNCLTCSGTSCNTAAGATSLRCENNNEQDCMTVFDVNGRVVTRGCSDAVEAANDAYCDVNQGSCFKCKSNDCNKAEALSEFTECIYCDTTKDRNCLWQPTNASLPGRQCQGGCMTALFPAIDGTPPTYELARTCANDMEAADQTTCAAGTNPNCAACTGARCNTADVPAVRHSCYICAGDDCESPVAKSCPLYRADDACFIWFDETNSIAEMGCFSSFLGHDVDTVLKTKRVLLCEGDNCNTWDKISAPQKCVVCNSKDNIYCATNAPEVGTIDTCSKMPYTECYSKLNTDGTTERGCLHELAEDAFIGCLLGTDENCGTCKGNVCNRDVFPPDRQQCYTCTSLDDNSCESYPTRKLACPTIKSTEACMTALSGNTTVRGCSSEIYCDSTDISTCRSCFGSECNAIDLRNRIDDGLHGLWQGLPLHCHSCDGDHCKASLGPAYACTKDINQDCMTVFNSSAVGDVLRRGCANDVEDYEDLYCRQHPDMCFKCKSNECNSAWSVSEYTECIFCDSAEDTTCITQPQSSSLATRACKGECMVAMKDSNRLIRSCLDDKELFVQQQCRANDGGKECTSCKGARCNDMAFPADRLSCYSCDTSTGGSNDCTNPRAEFCENYNETDACFAKFDSGHVSVMGCSSSRSSSELQTWADEHSLYQCQGNACNEFSKLPDSGDCVSCDSSKTPNCAQNPALVTTVETCPAPYSSCFTQINSAGHTIRGCASSLSQSELNSCMAGGTCVACDSGSSCNNEVFPNGRRQCHICNSVASDNCVTAPDASVICPIYAANDKCVASNIDDYVQRGCASSDLTCDTNDEEHCQICETDGCNNNDMSGAAAIAGFGVTLTLLLAAALSLHH